jgi:hypothetical protein
MMLTKQHLPILLKARELVDNGHDYFICHAIKRAGSLLDMHVAARQAHQYIKHEVGLGTLAGWVMDDMTTRLGERAITNKFGHLVEPYLVTLISNGNQLARLAWLDKMIHDIEAQP